MKYIDRKTATLIDQLLTTKYHYSFEILIEHAALAVARAATVVLKDKLKLPSADVLVLAGPGFNGADGLATARLLKLQGHSPRVVCFKPPQNSNSQRLTQLVGAFGIPVIQHVAWQKTHALLKQSDFIVDGIFGFSFKGEVRQPYGEVIRGLKEFQQKVLSIDIPSGWDPELGNDNGLFQPAYLVSLTLPKAGVKSFRGQHWLGGKFVPELLAQELQVQIPRYPQGESLIKLL